MKIAEQDINGKPIVREATQEEILALSLKSTNEQIMAMRAEAYREESDPLYMAYIKYKERDQTDKAATMYKAWEDKLSEIENRLPYI